MKPTSPQAAREIGERVTGAALTVLVTEGIPTDVLSLLMIGDPARNVRPGALNRALVVSLTALFNEADKVKAGFK